MIKYKKKYKRVCKKKEANSIFLPNIIRRREKID